jgi:succinylglutamate desuccinylase
MRTSGLFALALVACARADDPTPTEEAWHELESIANESALTVDDHLKMHGLNPDSVSALKRYAEKSMFEFNQWDDKHMEQTLCRQRAKYENDAERLADWFEKTDEERNKRMQKVIDDLPTAIGDSNAAAFLSFTEHKRFKKSSSITRPIPLIVSDLRRGASAREVLVDFCGAQS